MIILVSQLILKDNKFKFEHSDAEMSVSSMWRTADLVFSRKLWAGDFGVISS